MSKSISVPHAGGSADFEFLSILGLGPWVLENLPYSFQNDRLVVLCAVRVNGLVLRFASNSLKNDENLVLSAVKSNGMALQYAGMKLRKDKKIVWAAV